MSMRRCNARDKFALTSRRIDPVTKFLVAPANIASAGNVQTYSKRELGFDGDGVMRLFRPREEVFAPSSLASIDRAPITLGHPPSNVDAGSWREFAVGDAHDPMEHGAVVRSEVIVRDKKAIESVDGGKAEISLGYSFDLDETPGKTDDGQAYDGIMRKILVNHVAIVDVARGGPTLRISDQQPTKEDKTMRTIVVDGVSIKLEDDTAASLVEKVVGDSAKALKVATDSQATAETRATTAEKALADEKAATVKLVADHTTKVAELEAKVPKEGDIEKLAAERSKVVADAELLVEGFKAEGKTVAAIRTEALIEAVKDEALKTPVLAALGGVELAKADEKTIKTAFDVAVSVCNQDARDGVDQEHRASDMETARALSRSNRGPRKATKSIGDQLFERIKNNGKAPTESTKSA